MKLLAQIDIQFKGLLAGSPKCNDQDVLNFWTNLIKESKKADDLEFL